MEWLASAASTGSRGESSVVNRMPALRACSTRGTIAALSLGDIRIPFTPSNMQVSIAATCAS